VAADVAVAVVDLGVGLVAAVAAPAQIGWQWCTVWLPISCPSAPLRERCIEAGADVLLPLVM
jgi:hypothetical protein